MRYLTLTSLCLLILAESTISFAQSSKWGQRGGSTTNGYNEFPYETITDMGVDNNGNVYVLAVIESSGIVSVGDTTLSNTNGGRDILLASFSCDGILRWRKVIGGTADVDRPHALNVDSRGHVYITGNIYESSTPAHFDVDTSLPAVYRKTLFIAAYDTSGAFRWLRMPQADTLSDLTYVLSTSYDLSSDSIGNICMLAYLSAGQLAGTTLVADSSGPYIMKYSSTGTLLQLTPLDAQWNGVGAMATQFSSLKMAISPDGKIVLAGGVNYSPPFAYDFLLGGVPVVHSLFVARFDANGRLLWKQENTQALGSQVTTRPIVDAKGNIYIGGVAVNADSLETYQFTNATPIAYAMPMLVRLDSNGHIVWVRTASTNATNFVGGIAATGSEIIMTGSYPGLVAWDGTHTLSSAVGTSYDIFLTRFDMLSGNVIAIDAVKGTPGYADYSSSISADAHGNVFIGGFFSADLHIAGSTITNSGGDYDFFIAKYGYDCDCMVPVVDFTATQVAYDSIMCTYTGSSPVDSVRWNFGDGISTSGMTAYHRYDTVGTYTVCVTAYISCGMYEQCKTLTIPGLAVADPRTLPDIKISPDPVVNDLSIHNATGYTAGIYTTEGRLLQTWYIDSDASVHTVTFLPAGLYLLRLSNGFGMQTVKMIKM